MGGGGDQGLAVDASQVPALRVGVQLVKRPLHVHAPLLHIRPELLKRHTAVMVRICSSQSGSGEGIQLAVCRALETPQGLPNFRIVAAALSHGMHLVSYKQRHVEEAAGKDGNDLIGL